MTWWGWCLAVGIGLVLGVVLALILAHFRVVQVHDDAYLAGILAGQHQAELAHGTWHPADLGQSWNEPDVSRDRRWSSDFQLVTRAAPDLTPRIVDPR